MGWDSLVNQGIWSFATYADNARPWYVLKERLKANGWTVGPSGDGLAAYNASGDCLTGYGAGAGGMGQSRSWYATSDPDGQRHYLIQIDTGNTGWVNKCLIAVSHDTPFTGGSAIGRATSVDEVSPFGAKAVASADYGALGGDAYVHFIVGDAAVNGVWPFHMVRVYQPGPGGDTLCHFACIPVTDEDGGDTDPCVWSARDGQWCSTSLFSATATARAGCWYDIAGGGKAWVDTGAGASAHFDAGYHVPMLGAPGQLVRPDGDYVSERVKFWVTVGGVSTAKGVSNWIFQPIMGVGNVAYNAVLRDQNGEMYVAIEGAGANKGICYPGWPDIATCPLPDMGGGVVARDVYLLAAGGGPTMVYTNVVYDTVANAYVRWPTVNARGNTGLSYPGPGAYPGDWLSGSYATESYRVY